MAAIYNFTQVPLTLPLEAAVKNRHGRRVIRGGRRRRNRKRGLNKEIMAISAEYLWIF